MRGSWSELTVPKLAPSLMLLSTPEVRMVEQVECLGAQLEVDILANFGVLGEGHVPLLQPGAQQRAVTVLPKAPAAAWKEEVLNHCATVLVMCTGAIWSGRAEIWPSGLLMPMPLRPWPGSVVAGSQSPVPAWVGQAKGSEDCTTENDVPEIAEVIPDNSQPPRNLPSMPLCPLKMGRL
jgi:hypothetical protein